MLRKTDQFLLPVYKNKSTQRTSEIYPSYTTIDSKILEGYKSLVNYIVDENFIIIDGYIGVDWNEVITTISQLLIEKGKKISIQNIDHCLKSEETIERMISPYLGGDDPIFGKKTSLSLIDYFEHDKLESIRLDSACDIHIIYGCGSSLSGIKGLLLYFDLPKNELQYRMRAKSITNLGYKHPKDSKQMYKHFYFVDWILLNKEKKKLLPSIDIFVDQQRPNIPTWMLGDGLRKTLNKMSLTYFRVRPWFEPGVWGGQWIKNHFDQLNHDVPNYAWSFEMIVPENGLLLENESLLLEVSFDLLLFQEQKNVLGNASKRFQDEFPIRFDFLDTFQGGNLSVQVHPKPDYIKNEFGESFTQDETYYILDSGDDANVYIGFQEDINPAKFKEDLENCYQTKEILEVEKYIQKHPAKKHDLFLIPHGTPHCSGINNMVLEISATPYIYTFKMYDWQRLDLDGKPRPLNINRAFENLDFSRKGNVVPETLISKPIVSDYGDNWKKVQLPTHKDHFYEIYRYEFDVEMEIETLNQCHVLMLVEGTSINLDLKNESHTFNYAETFAIPAATGSYKLINNGNKKAKVIVSFVKEGAC